MDLIASFNKLTQLVSNDVKKIGEQIAQIVAKVSQIDQRLSALEQRSGGAAMNGVSQNGRTQVVNGQVVPGPAAQPGAPDATKLWYGDPDAFTKGDD